MLTDAQLDELAIDLAKYQDDPYGFVMWAFPWGEGELAGHTGPDEWQAELLNGVGEAIRSGKCPGEAILEGTASGHGIGKSALVAWLNIWAFTTFPGTRGVVTANTENQLKTKTWVEMRKWVRLFIGSELINITATSMFPAADKKMQGEWRIDLVPWSEHNVQAFAGLHNEGKRLILTFDEASTIPAIIWETAMGALTDETCQILWFCFGNPTESDGQFRQIFAGGRFAHRWNTRRIDSRTVKITNKKEIARWVEDYGEDSDFVRVRVTGHFPRVNAESWISYDMAYSATLRDILPQTTQPIIVGVDVGRQGDDPSVIYCRQGRDARTRPPVPVFEKDTMVLVGKVIEVFRKEGASVCMVDGGGVGGGVVDRLRELHIPVVDVQFGAAPGIGIYDHSTRCRNERSRLFCDLREWLNSGGAIVEEVTGLERTLPKDMAATTYTSPNDLLLMEPKESIKRREGWSTDPTDALLCTFAMPWLEHMPTQTNDESYEDYNPFEAF